MIALVHYQVNTIQPGMIPINITELGRRQQKNHTLHTMIMKMIMMLIMMMTVTVTVMAMFMIMIMKKYMYIYVFMSDFYSKLMIICRSVSDFRYILHFQGEMI